MSLGRRRTADSGTATPSRRAPRSGEPADQIDAHCPQRGVVQSWPPSLPVVWLFANNRAAGAGSALTNVRNQLVSFSQVSPGFARFGGTTSQAGDG